MKKISPIYCDFDGTITKHDAVNTFFEMYAPKEWLEYEALWVAGKITSKENAIKQVGLLSGVTQKQLSEYINSIQIDEYFLDFIKFVRKENIKFTILSDGFDMFINKTLEKHGITNIPVYANHLIYDNGKFRIEFPYHNSLCDIGAGMCKCEKVKEAEFCYIGDGTSDLCVAQKADVLFATKKLRKYCDENALKYFSFDTFKDIKEIIEYNTFVI